MGDEVVEATVMCDVCGTDRIFVSESIVGGNSLRKLVVGGRRQLKLYLAALISMWIRYGTIGY